jgi:hypothetical protein
LDVSQDHIQCLQLYLKIKFFETRTGENLASEPVVEPAQPVE